MLAHRETQFVCLHAYTQDAFIATSRSLNLHRLLHGFLFLYFEHKRAQESASCCIKNTLARESQTLTCIWLLSLVFTTNFTHLYYRCMFVSKPTNDHRNAHVLNTSMTARKEYSAPGLHTWVALSPQLSDLGPTIFCLLPLNVLSMLPSISPPQCKVGPLFKPLLPLTPMQEKDLPMMKNSADPPSILQALPKSQPQTRPSSNSLNNGGTL